MIFNLLKSKPTLKELIPKGFVDIHSHILPGIDDGAKDVNESEKLIKKMKRLGFSKIIATPHIYEGLYNNTPNTIKKSYNLLSSNLKKKNKIKYAAEYLIDYKILNRLEEKSLLCLKDKYILVEMSYLNKPNNLYEIIYNILINGFVPILSHPERYQYFHKNFDEYRKLKNVGCKFQLNLLSTVGYYGKKVLLISEKLINENLVDFVGSDIHNVIQCNEFEKKVLISNLKGFEKVINFNNYFN